MCVCVTVALSSLYTDTAFIYNLSTLSYVCQYIQYRTCDVNIIDPIKLSHTMMIIVMVSRRCM